ncbi:MAG TPA: hypothetical protein VJH03_06825 [Blastocatellia bacterium]|nr:hypothetical protein [Blastocatellia bacterium]
MNGIADRGLGIGDSEMQIDAPAQPAANGLSPSIRAMTPGNPQSAIRNSQSVELHIEELVLHAFAPGDRYRIGDAVERELMRLFTEQGVPSQMTQGGEIAHALGAALEIQPGSSSEMIGVKLAKAIYGGFGR